MSTQAGLGFCQSDCMACRSKMMKNGKAVKVFGTGNLLAASLVVILAQAQTEQNLRLRPIGVISNTSVMLSPGPTAFTNQADSLDDTNIPVSEPSRTVPVTAALAASTAELKPGEDFELRVRVRIAASFHIYSTNAGQGPFAATQVSVKLPKDVEAESNWAFRDPVRLRNGDLVYSHSVIFRRLLKVRTNASPGEVSFSGHLVCQPCTEEFCWPPRTLPLSGSITIQNTKKE